MSVQERYGSDLVNKAYLVAHRAGSGGKLSKVELAELIVREGIPEDLADQAAKDTLEEVLKLRQKEGRQQMSYGLYILAIGIVLMIASVVVLKITVMIPVGIIFFGFALAMAGYSRSKRKRL